MPRDLYGILITCGGAAVFHQTKKIGVWCDGSQMSEGIASGQADKVLAYAQEVERAFGISTGQPAVLGTDNKSNMQICMRKGAANRAKHMLRRYYSLLQRVKAGDIKVLHIPGEQNPADFLTKFLPAAKLRASIRLRERC